MHKGERFNSITHLVGAAVALAGAAVLVVLASLQGDPWKIVSFSIYGASLFLLYLFSTLYHSFRAGAAKSVFKRLDHQAIYLLIAGSYTPLALVTMNGPWGWSIFGVIWGLAVFGIVFDWVAPKKKVLPIVVYLLMGWLIVIALRPLLRTLPMAGFIWLLVGGLLYSGGVVFYVLDERRHFHGIWHLFVLGGSVCQYFTFLFYVL